MMALLNKVAPSATDMIRADHTRVLAGFHRYDVSGSPALKQAIVGSLCIALEVHAQIEEEIFYPALRSIDPGVIDKSIPEHDEMRRRIASLRQMDASSALYDDTVMELMRNVMHHVADEETTLLVDAEKRMPERIGELGALMTKRRLQLMGPRAGEMMLSSVRAMPKSTMLLGAAAVAAAAGLMLVFRRKSGTGTDFLRNKIGI
jgi:hemerythrin superfamily protein